MFIDTTLLINDPFILKGLLDGTLVRYGSVIRWAAGTEKAGQIFRHLAEAPGFTNKLITLPFSPVLGGASLVTDIIGHGITINKLFGIERTLSSVLQLSQIAAGASVLNLGVSILGFAYMGYKLHEIQKAIGNLQQSMEAGFSRIDNRLDKISGQLAYLHLLVEDSRQKQQSLAQAISNLHRTILIKEISDLAAEIINHSRFPEASPKEAIKTSSRVRLFLANQAMQATPELDAEIMLNTDVSIQGWAVATATEANLLLEMGNFREARELLAQEIPKFKQVAVRWAEKLIETERPELATAYRFTAPCFQEHISQERVNRIINISSVDESLSSEQIRRKKNEIEVEFEMSYSSQFDETWRHRQVAVAEYLDTLSELSARLDSLQPFAALCESQNVKSSRDILPDANAEIGLYTLSLEKSKTNEG